VTPAGTGTDGKATTSLLKIMGALPDGAGPVRRMVSSRPEPPEIVHGFAVTENSETPVKAAPVELHTPQSMDRPQELV
jgi:hypothetical protein